MADSGQKNETPQNADADQVKVLLPDAARAADVNVKQKRAARFLELAGVDAILLQKPENVAWFTAGADITRAGSSETTAAAFITADARLIVSNNVDAPLLFERELFGLGFQLKQRPWHKPISELLQDLIRGRKVASDTGFPGTKWMNGTERTLRGSLTNLECERMRKLGRVVAHAVEATAKSFERGSTEAEVAAQVAHRLIKRNVQPERIQVCADGRVNRFRHWTYSRDPVNQSAVISCVARRWGLCAGVTRIVSFDNVAKELRAAHEKTVLMHATGMFFSRHGERLHDIWMKVHRIYEKFGLPFEWQLADQAELIGYGVREASIVTDVDQTVDAPATMFWHPSVGPSMTGDTILIGQTGAELVTPIRNWKQLSVKVRGVSVQVADILVRNTRTEPLAAMQNSGVIQLSNMALSDPDMGTMDSIWEMETTRSE